MKFYEWVLGVDTQRDLTDPKVGREWGYTRVFGLEEEGEDGSFRPIREWFEHGRVKTLRTATQQLEFELEDWFVAWIRNVRAFRSLSQRLANAETRAPGIEALDADEIFRGYLSLPVRVEIDHKPVWEADEKTDPPALGDPERVMKRILGTVRPLTSESFVGLKLRPGNVGHLHSFWQDVFLSLADERHAGVPVCQECRQKLPPTRKGKPSRRVVCKKCQAKLWYAKADKEELREKNREYKAEQRKRERESGGNTPGRR